MVKNPVPREQILQGDPPEVKAIANRLRQIIKRTVEGAQESGYPGWHAIGYRHPAAGYFCGLSPLKDRVKLYFEHGSALSDPGGLLLGGAKMQVRYLEFRRASDIDEGAQ